MTNKRKYWLTKALASLDQTYDHLSEAISLTPEDEDFDAIVDQYQQLLHDLRQNIHTLWAKA